MRVARALPEIPHGAEIEVGALYRLAARSTPDAVRAKYLERAATGERVRARDVEEDLTPPSPPTARPEIRGIFDDDEELNAEVATQLARAEGHRARRAEERRQERERWGPFRPGPAVPTGPTGPASPAKLIVLPTPPPRAEAEEPEPADPEFLVVAGQTQRLLLGFDPAEVVAALDETDFGRVGRFANDLLRWAELLVAALDERWDDQGRAS